MHVMRFLVHSLFLVAMALGSVVVGNTVWATSGQFAAALIYFFLALTYLGCIATAWFAPSPRVPVLGMVVTLLVLGASLDWRLPKALFESALALVLLSYICWSTLHALVRIRLPANYALKRTAAELLR